MSREIKFRAWDKEAKAWIHEPLMFYMQNHQPFASTLHVHHPQSVEIMQYTGLKEKNGKEIYEGDIVSYHDGDEDPLVIEFERGCFWHHGGYGDASPTSDEYEVIGNIYENPELLKDPS